MTYLFEVITFFSGILVGAGFTLLYFLQWDPKKGKWVFKSPKED